MNAAIYPRAIYMTGQEAAPTAYHYDSSRYESHEELKTPEGDPILLPEHNPVLLF